MKKFIIGFMVSLTLWSAVPITADARLFDSFESFNEGVGNFTGSLREVGGVVRQVGGLVSDVRSIFGGGSSRGSSGGYSRGSFDGDTARIFDGDVLGGGLNVGVDNIVTNSVVIVQDFDALFDGLQPEPGVVPTGEFVLPAPENFNQIGENTSLRQYILNVLNFALSFLGLIAVAFIVYAGFLYVTSGGDDGNMEKAKKIVLYAVIGILLILASFAIINTVIQNAGRGTDDRGTVANIPGTTVVTRADGTQVITGGRGQAPGVINGTNGSQFINGGNGQIPGIIGSSSGAQNAGGGRGRISGVINTATGTQIPIISGSGFETPGASMSSNLSSLITVTGAGVQDYGRTAVVTPDAARAGVAFGLSTQGQALFDFGDGTQGILNTLDNPGATIVHPFGEERTYAVRVIIENPQGSVPARKDLVVGGLEAKFTMNKAEMTVNETLALNASSTQVAIGSVRSYGWSCSGGTGCFEDTFGQKTSVEFTTPGEYNVTLTVENVLGAVDTFEKTVRVIGGSPTAAFIYQSTGNLNKPGEFVFNASRSVSRTGEPRGLTYFWDIDGDFQQSSGPTLRYEFASTGEKQVKLVVVESLRGDTLRSEAFEEVVVVETVVPVDFTVE